MLESFRKRCKVRSVELPVAHASWFFNTEPGNSYFELSRRFAVLDRFGIDHYSARFGLQCPNVLTSNVPVGSVGAEALLDCIRSRVDAVCLTVIVA